MYLRKYVVRGNLNEKIYATNYYTAEKIKIGQYFHSPAGEQSSG